MSATFYRLVDPTYILLVTICLSPRATAAPGRTFSFGADTPTANSTKVAPGDVYSQDRGYGFDLNTSPAQKNAPFFFSVHLPEGVYKINISLGDQADSSATTLKAESRQLILENVRTKPGEQRVHSFFVSVRNSTLPFPPKNAPGGSAVLLNEREKGILRWDDKLTLEFDGENPRLTRLSIEPASVPIIYLAGDSTVTDQPYEPGASWGQMLPRFLSGVAVANHAESGETIKSFISELRLAKIMSQIHAGDYLLIQFGHNDEKKQWPQTYVDARTTYKDYLRALIDEARLRQATPILVTPLQRRVFDSQNQIRNTHGDYPEAVRELAAEEHIELIDLARLSATFFEALGPEKAPLAFSGGGKDITHQNNYGAYELAKCVIESIQESKSPLAKYINPDFTGFDPGHPDNPDTFHFDKSALESEVAPRGN